MRDVAARLGRVVPLCAACVAWASLATPLFAQDQLEVLWTHSGTGSSALAFSPDGRWLAAAQDGVEVRRVADGTLMGTISNAFGGVMSLAFSPDSLQLASGDDNGVVCVHNIWDASLAWDLAVGGDVTGVAYGPGGTLASWSSNEEAVELWQADTGLFSQSYTGYQWSHYGVAFPPDGTLAAMGGDANPTVKLLSVADGRVIRELVGHTNRVRTVVFSADGAALVTGGDDASIRFWRVSDGALLRSLSGHTGGIWKVAIAANSVLASTSNDGTLRLWRMTDGALLRTYATGIGASYSVEFSPDGSLFAFERDNEVVVARNPMPAITCQPTRLTRFAGQTATLTVSATGDGPLSYQWKRDGVVLSGATNAILTFTNHALTDDGTYAVEVSNSLGTVVSCTAGLTVLDRPAGPGSLDVGFDPNGAGERLGFGGGIPGARAVVLEPDGRFVIGGFFAGVNGTVRRHLARLRQDGTVDLSFDPGLGLDGEVTALARQADGALVVAGLFNAADSRSHGQLVRLDAAGRVDPGFKVTLSNSTWTTVASLSSVAVQSDGHIWVCGSFTTVNGSPCTNLARLKSDGTLDTTFTLGGLAVQGNQWVDRVLVQSDDKVLLAGCWTNPACSLIRLQADGTLDPSFVSPTAYGYGGTSPSHINDLATYRDGWIAMVGEFRMVNGATRGGVARLLSDGTLDTSFDPKSGAEDSTARTVAIEPDGRLVIGGWFTRVRGATRSGFARFNADGTLDTTFDPGSAVGHTGRPNVNALIRQSDGRYLVGADDWFAQGTNCVLRLLPTGGRDASLQATLQVEPIEIRTAALQSDGHLLVAGYFTSVNGIARPGLARLGLDGLADATFAPPTDLNVQVWAIAIQEDQKMLVGGLSTSWSGEKAVVRLNVDGSLDPAFSSPAIQGPSSMVETIAPQADGRILIGGLFSTVGGLARSGIARLNSDGTVDEGFKPPEIVTSDDEGYGVEFIHVLSDQRILIAGGFGSSSGTLASIARLKTDGSLDTTFAPELPEVQPVRALAVQSDGRLLLAGPFQTGEVWGRLLRLWPDGGTDATFQPDVGAGITALAVQADGRILVATNTDHTGTVIRLKSDGTRDTVWRTSIEATESYMSTAVLLPQASGEAIVVGEWQSVGGVPRAGLARLNGDASACHLRVRAGLTAVGAFPFQFIGIDRGHFRIETSDDLRNWKTWLDLENPVSPLDLLDSDTAGVAHRFFRARLLP